MFAHLLPRLAPLVSALVLCLAALPAYSQEAAPAAGGLPEITVRANSFDSLTKIAVPDTVNLGDTDPRGVQASASATIRGCLMLAGYFNVLTPDRYFFDTSREGITAANTNFQNWFNVGAQFVVKVGFRVATNQVRLDMRLFDVNSQAQVDIGYEPRTVGLDETGAEVYRFVNLLIKYFTGSEGMFGTRIAFVGRSRGSKQVFTMNMDGTGVTPVSNNRSINILPAWGPGGEVMYTSFANGNPDLVIGSGARAISSQPGLNSGAALRPGGGEVAVSLSKDGNSEIYIVSPAGDIIRRCTDNAAEDVSASWSPDGAQIAFVSDRSGGPQVFVMNADCSNQRRVTFSGSYNTAPDWSPRGDQIAFTGRDGTRQDIFTVEPATGFVARLTQDSGDNEEPSWSPDGNLLVFSSTRGGKKKLYVMPSTGFPQVEIPAVGSGYEQPAWQR